MAQTMLDRDYTDTGTGRLDAPGQAGSSAGASSPAATGWMWTWVIIGILVVLVVIAFLLGIVSALTAIDDALAEADEAVTSIRGDVQGVPSPETQAALEEAGIEPIDDPQPLPTNIQNINSNLTSIDGELAAVPGQADDIIAALADIEGTLSNVDGSLAGTSSTLAGTDSSLVDTSGMLQDTQGIANSIRVSLEDTQSNPANLGSEDIWMRVGVANDVLVSARSDTGNIVPDLQGTLGHLNSICRTLLGPC